MGWMLITVAVVFALAGLVFLAPPLASRMRRRDEIRAIRLFPQRREMLEAKFFDLARIHGKPRGLKWLDCEWMKDVTFARDKNSGLITAFVSVNIRFEAVEGGDMEGVAAVDTVRDAVALFHYHNGTWGTGGKALFNMNPHEALERLVAQFAPVQAS